MRKSRFLKFILGGGGPSGWELAAYGLGVLAIGLAGEFLANLLGAVWAQAALVLVLLGVAYYLFRVGQKHRQLAPVFELESPTRFHRAIVWSLGPGPIEHLKFALGHHCSAGGEHTCWLITQKDDAITARYSEVVAWAHEHWPKLTVCQVCIANPAAGDCYHAAEGIILDSGRQGLSAQDIAVDITGGVRSMMVGLMLAAMEHGCNLEFVTAEYGPAGPRPVRVESLRTRFVVERF